MKRIYLAARYSRREELCRYRRELERYGFIVTSRWLNGNCHGERRGLSPESVEADRVRFATEDWEDLMRASVAISFTEDRKLRWPPSDRPHVEFGAALATDKRVMVVGPRESAFHYLPGVEVFPEWGDAKRVLVAGKRTPSLPTQEAASPA